MTSTRSRPSFMRPASQVASSRVVICTPRSSRRDHEFLRFDEGKDALPLAVHGLDRIAATAALTGRHFHQRHLQAAGQSPGVVIDDFIHPAWHALADGNDANAHCAPPPG